MGSEKRNPCLDRIAGTNLAHLLQVSTTTLAYGEHCSQPQHTYNIHIFKHPINGYNIASLEPVVIHQENLNLETRSPMAAAW